LAKYFNKLCGHEKVGYLLKLTKNAAGAAAEASKRRKSSRKRMENIKENRCQMPLAKESNFNVLSQATTAFQYK